MAWAGSPYDKALPGQTVSEPVLGAKGGREVATKRTGLPWVDALINAVGGSPTDLPSPTPAAVTSQSMLKALENRGLMHRLQELLQIPEVAKQLNVMWSDIGRTPQAVEPQFLSRGIDAAGFKVQPFSRGGEVLKIFDAPLHRNAGTVQTPQRDLLRASPESAMLKARLWGDIPNERGEPEMGWAVQPLADMRWKSKQQYPPADVLDYLRRMADRDGWYLTDEHSGNIGMFRNRPVVIDFGSLMPQSHEVLKSNPIRPVPLGLREASLPTPKLPDAPAGRARMQGQRMVLQKLREAEQMLGHELSPDDVQRVMQGITPRAVRDMRKINERWGTRPPAPAPAEPRSTDMRWEQGIRDQMQREPGRSLPTPSDPPWWTPHMDLVPPKQQAPFTAPAGKRWTFGGPEPNLVSDGPYIPAANKRWGPVRRLQDDDVQAWRAKGWTPSPGGQNFNKAKPPSQQPTSQVRPVRTEDFP